MNQVEESIERLIKLSELMRRLAKEEHPHFNLSTWISSYWEREEDKALAGNLPLNEMTCSTYACAAGHACLDPWFRQQGLRFVFNELGALFPSYNGKISYYALAEFFHISLRDAEDLFSPHAYTYQQRQDPNAVADKVDNQLDKLIPSLLLSEVFHKRSE